MKMNKNKQIIIVIALIILMVGIYFLAQSDYVSQWGLIDNGETLAATSTTKMTKCSDTDGGVDVFNIGTTSQLSPSGQNLLYLDTCLNSKYINEYYCQFATNSPNARIIKKQIKCPKNCVYTPLGGYCTF